MKRGRKTQVLDMSPAAWSALERLARETNSLATKGSRLGKPSWRAMIRRLAAGELVLAQAHEASPLAEQPLATLLTIEAMAKTASLPSSASLSTEATTQPLTEQLKT